MWLPETAAEVEAALAGGQLEETHTFDGKLLPGKNPDIAVDVCAMTPDGGSLVYGIGEDARKRLTVASPFPLAGVAGRIDQIVQTSIVEVPTITVSELPTDNDPSVGYVVVGVPQSPRAPHQVIVGKDMRFYGRGATGNRILAEREIAELYARRQRWELDREKHLEHVLAGSPLPPHFDYPSMHAFARPVTFDAKYLRAQLERDEMELRNALKAATLAVDESVGYVPDLRNTSGWRLFGAEGLVLEVGIGQDRRRSIRMTIGHSGEGRLYTCAGARYDGDGVLGIFELVIGGNLVSFMSAIGAMYRLAGYVGNVDVGVAVTEIAGGVSDSMHVHGWAERPYPTDSFRANDRVIARS